LPSDPRVIYLGGDEKYEYASIELKPESRDEQYASAANDADDARVISPGEHV
jgi:hypothetical protein